MPALMRSADVLLNLSPGGPLARVTIEAMACGVPVIAVSSGAHQDAVLDGTTGYLIASAQPAPLARRIRQLLATPLREGMAIAAASRARDRYSWERIGLETLAVYETAVREAAPAAEEPEPAQCRRRPGRRPVAWRRCPGHRNWARRRDFPPHVLREYALLADGERGALVGPRGDVAWLCAPGWDSDAVFACLIGGRGVYAVTPDRTRFVWGGYYEDGSLIWRSRWVTATGFTECREALGYPGDPDTAVLLRRVLAVDGPARVKVVLDLRAGFGRHRMTQLRSAAGIWTARSGPLRMRWSGGAGARVRPDGALELTLALDAGQQHDLVLELSSRPLSRRPADPAAGWQATERAWAAALPKLGASLAPAGSQHSYAVLTGLTSRSAGMVAAATMSLPERSQAGRNYDYRYVWIRDQCYTGQAVAADGPHRLLDDAVAFVAERVLADGPRAEAGLHGVPRPGAGRAPAAHAGRLSGRRGQGRQLGQPAVPARRAGRRAAAVRRRGPARPPGHRALAGGGGGGPGHRDPLA